MKFACDRLTAFTRNRFRLENAGSASAGPGQMITVNIPSNSLVDMHSLKMHATFKSSGGTPYVAATAASRPTANNASFFKPGLPNDMHHLIQRMTVSANGTSIQQGANEYNTIHSVKSTVDRTLDSNLSTHNCLSYTNAQYQALKGGGFYGGSADGTTAPNSDDFQNNTFYYDGDRVGDTRDFTLYDWRGFFKDGSTRYLPTDLLGAVQIQLTLAGAYILPIVGVGPQKTSVTNFPDVSYTLDNIYWTIDTISVDQMYGQMLRKRIADSGSICLLYKEFYTFQNAADNAPTSVDQKWSLSTGSLDRIYTVMRDGEYASQFHVATVAAKTAAYRELGHVGAHSHLLGGSKHFEYIVPGLQLLGHDATAEAKGLLDTTSFPFYAYDNDHDVKYYFRINSVQHPQYEATPRDAIFDLAYASDSINSRLGHTIASRAEWWNEKGIFTCPLNLTDGPLTLMSGYDSRGHSSYMEFHCNGLHPTGFKQKFACPSGKINITTICETTSELRIGAGTALAVAR